MQHDGIKKRLLAEKDHNFKKPLDFSTTIEAAERDTKDLKNATTSPFPVQALHYDTVERNGRYFVRNKNMLQEYAELEYQISIKGIQGP